MHALDAPAAARTRADGFEDGMLRQGEAVSGCFDDQSGGDREGQRNFQRKARAAPHHRRQSHGSADRFDILANHVHADAATRNACHPTRRREPRREDEAADVVIGHARQFGFADEAEAQRLCPNPLDIEPASVIGNGDVDMTRLVRGRNADCSFLRLAGGAPLRRQLDAVIGAVADHMRERIADEFDELPVELRIGAGRSQLDFLPDVVRQFPHQPRQIREQPPDRLHPGPHHGVLQIARQRRQSLQRRLDRILGETSRDLQQLVAGEHQFGDQCHDPLERTDTDPDYRRQTADRPLRIGIVPAGAAELTLAAGGFKCGYSGSCSAGSRDNGVSDSDSLRFCFGPRPRCRAQRSNRHRRRAVRWRCSRVQRG